jgi:3-hydroxy acid dehydrogenase/malonic semialdehyde reductase
LQLSKGGANVILLARRADALSKVSDACVNAHKESGLQQGGKFASVQLDVSDKQQIASLWTKVPQDLRNVDILGKSIHLGTPILTDTLFSKVNNTGYVLGVEHVGDISDKNVEGMFATNVFGLISLTQLLVKGSQS